MKNIRVKICGITSLQDALNVCDAGADAIGLVFYEKSKRHVSIQTARHIYENMPPFVSVVGLFLDASSDFVNAVLDEVPLDLLQFHGAETPDYCRSFRRPYIKAVGIKDMHSEADFARYADQYTTAKGFLVDSHAFGKAGGTGETFDWRKTPQNYTKPIILAGGLDASNVATALQQASVYGVDLSSGVESSPGIKDNDKINALMQEVKRVSK